jgi:hypothetical protein
MTADELADLLQNHMDELEDINPTAAQQIRREHGEFWNAGVFWRRNVEVYSGLAALALEKLDAAIYGPVTIPD